MSKRKNLNGLPNSLTQRFLSTLFYFDGGYMPDWIWQTALEFKIKKFKINILEGSFEPTEIVCYPITHQLELLRTDISEALIREGFDQELITEAYFIIELPEQYVALQMISCQAIVVDRTGRKIIGKIYTERSFESQRSINRNSNQPNKRETMFTKIRNWLKV